MFRIFVSLLLFCMTGVVKAGMPVAVVGAFQKDTYCFYREAKTSGGSFDTIQLIWLNQFILGCKTDGNYSQISMFMPFLGTTVSAASISMSGGAGDAQKQTTSGPFTDYTSSGLKGDGASYVEVAGATPATSNSCNVCIYVTDAGDLGNEVDYGAQEGGNTILNMYIPDVSTGDIVFDAYNQNSGEGRNQIANVSLVGLFMGNRIPTDNESAIYFMDTLGGFQLLNSFQGIGGTVPTISHLLFAMNNQGTPSNHSTKRLSFFSIGSGFTQAQATLYGTRIQTLQSKLGRAQ